MKIKLEKISNAGAAISKILNKELPFKTAYSLSKLLRKLKDELEIIEKNRNDLIKKYGDPEKGYTVVLQNKIHLFKQEHDEALQMEVEIEVPQIPLSQFELKDKDGKELIQLSAADLINLEPFISE